MVNLDRRIIHRHALLYLLLSYPHFCIGRRDVPCTTSHSMCNLLIWINIHFYLELVGCTFVLHVTALGNIKIEEAVVVEGIGNRVEVEK
jgi:hypothetical protein